MELKSVGQNDINDSHQPSQLSHRFDIVQDFYGDPGDQRRWEWPFVGTRLGRGDVGTEIVTWGQVKDESYSGSCSHLNAKKHGICYVIGTGTTTH